MPTTTFENSARKQHQSLLGNVFGKLGSSKKKTPATRHAANDLEGPANQTKRTLFSPFSPSRLPKSAQKTVSRASPIRLFGRGAERAERADDQGLIPAMHGNTVPSSSIKVVVRVRPKSDRERAVGVSVQGGGGVASTDTLSIQAASGERLTFAYDKVLGADKDQRDVYVAAGRCVVENVLLGFNGCLLAYGQTGSGKTYSMTGSEAGGESRGIIQRSFEELFAKIEERTEYTANVSCSFVEIYNETISDLTSPDASNLSIRDDRSGGCFVEGVQWHRVLSLSDVHHVLALGMANRRVAETQANDRSSRSHSVFTATIEQRSGDGVVLRSRLHMVDLAGSERQKASGAVGERLKEASNINKSLSALGHVIMSLVDVQQGKKRHVPYRDSKLTYLLQDALGGTAKVCSRRLSLLSLNADRQLPPSSTLPFSLFVRLHHRPSSWRR